MSAESSPIRVLIADDHPMVRLGVGNALAAFPDIRIVAEAATGEEALAATARTSIDVALLDLYLPDVDGFALIESFSGKLPVVVLTSSQVPSDLLRAMETGALAVLMKNVNGTVIAEALRAAAEGRSYYEESVMRLVLEAKGRRHGADPFVDLTGRERDVLELIGQGLTNDEIADRLFLSRKTVKFHVGNILAKVRVADRTKLAVLYLRSRADPEA